jgi:hypothetical protein
VSTHSDPHPDLAGYVLGVLTPQQARAFERHLRACEACRTEIQELGGIPVLLAAGSAQIQPPADLRTRTLARIGADARAAADGAPGALSGTVPRQPPAAPGPSPVDRRWHLRARPWSFAAAVAAAVMVLGVGVATALINTGVRLGDTSAGGGPPGGGSGGGTASVRTLTLMATGGGPQRGTAHIRNTPRGRLVDLEIDSLKPPPRGHHYVSWFVGPRDSPADPDRVVIGSFIPISDLVRVSFTSHASPAYERIEITSEPDDAEPNEGGRILPGRTVLTTAPDSGDEPPRKGR